VVTSILTEWEAKDLAEVAEETVWRKGRGPSIERVSGDVRICIWQRQNSTLSILQYWSVSDAQVLQNIEAFRRRFPNASMNTLMKVSSPSKYLKGRWEFTVKGQTKWVERLLFGTPTPRNEAVTALQTITSTHLRDLPKGWVYYTARKIMADYIQTDTNSPAYKLGALYAAGEEMAGYAVRGSGYPTKGSKAAQKRIFFRKFYKLVQNRPKVAVPGIMEHILRLDRQGHTRLRAFGFLRDLWVEASEGITIVPDNLSTDDRLQFQQGYAQMQAVIKAGTDAFYESRRAENGGTKVAYSEDENVEATTDDDLAPCI
jgi:hypothetical protein